MANFNGPPGPFGPVEPYYNNLDSAPPGYPRYPQRDFSEVQNSNQKRPRGDGHGYYGRSGVKHSRGRGKHFKVRGGGGGGRAVRNVQCTPSILGCYRPPPESLRTIKSRVTPPSSIPEYQLPTLGQGELANQLESLGIEGNSIDFFQSNVGKVEAVSASSGDWFDDDDCSYSRIMMVDSYKYQLIKEYVEKLPSDIQQFIREKDDRIAFLEGEVTRLRQVCSCSLGETALKPV